MFEFMNGLFGGEKVEGEFELCGCGVVGCCGCGYESPVTYSDAASSVSRRSEVDVIYDAEYEAELARERLGKYRRCDVGGCDGGPGCVNDSGRSMASFSGDDNLFGSDPFAGFDALMTYVFCADVPDCVGEGSERVVVTRNDVLNRGYLTLGFPELWKADFQSESFEVLKWSPDDFVYTAQYGSVKAYLEQVHSVQLKEFFESVMGFDPYERLKFILYDYVEEVALQIAAYIGDIMLSMAVRRDHKFEKIERVSQELSVECSRDVQCARLRKIFWTGTGIKASIPRTYGSKLYEAMVFLSAQDDFKSYFDTGGEWGSLVEKCDIDPWFLQVLAKELDDPQVAESNGSVVEVDVAELGSFLGLVRLGSIENSFEWFGMSFGQVTIKTEQYQKLVCYAADVMRYICVIVAIAYGYDLNEFLKKEPIIRSTKFVGSCFKDHPFAVKSKVSIRDYWSLMFLFLYENHCNRCLVDLGLEILNAANVPVTMRHLIDAGKLHLAIQMIDNEWYVD